MWLIRDSCRNVLKRAVYSCRLILGYLRALEESACLPDGSQKAEEAFSFN